MDPDKRYQTLSQFLFLEEIIRKPCKTKSYKHLIWLHAVIFGSHSNQFLHGRTMVARNE